jgi:hypothetical protein
LGHTRIVAGALALALAFATGCSSDDDAKKPETSATDSSTSTTPGNIDLRDYLPSTLLVAWPKEGAGLKRGQWLETKNTSIGKDGKPSSSTTRVAIVGEEGPHFLVEESGSSDEIFHGFIEGLTVEKATGKVVAAIAAKKGEKGKSIKLGPEPAPATSANVTTADETVTVPAGTFAATKTTTAGMLSETCVWVGKDADARGIPVKETSDETVLRELKSLAVEDFAVGGKTLKATHATYSDGSESWFVRNVSVPFHGTGTTTWVKQSRGGTTTELAWGDDAKPEIDWTK